MQINVREVPVPGVGVRFELDQHDGGTLFVIAERSGRRHLGATRPGEDRPAWSVALDQRQAVTIAALLLGALHRGRAMATATAVAVAVATQRQWWSTPCSSGPTRRCSAAP
ncbi:MAG: hypothetical protein R2755_21815 [Acidimicrobiales bacterium]